MDAPAPSSDEEPSQLPTLPLGSYRKGSAILTPQSERWGDDFTERDFGRWRSVAMALIKPENQNQSQSQSQSQSQNTQTQNPTQTQTQTQTQTPAQSQQPTAKSPPTSTEAGLALLAALQRALARQLATHSGGGGGGAKGSSWREQAGWALAMTAAEAAAFLGDHAKALEQYESILGKLEGGGNPKVEGTALVSAGQVHLQLGQVEAAAEKLQRGLAVAKKSHIPQLQAVAHLALGGLHERRERLDLALHEYEQAFSVLRDCGDLGGCGTALAEQARVCEALGRGEQAARLYQQLLAIVRGRGGGEEGQQQQRLTEEEIKRKIRVLTQTSTAATMPDDVD